MQHFRTSFIFCAFLLLLALSPTHGARAEDTIAPTPTPILEPQRTIRKVTVVVRDVFEDPDLPWLYRTANQLKVNSKDEVVRRELLFKEGDVYDQFAVTESERILRLMPYLRNIKVTPVLDGNSVDITVDVQDTWTFLPQMNYSSGTGGTTRSIGVAENNILGYGKRMEVLYEQEENRNTVQALVDDTRVWGTFNRVFLAHFDRSDGKRSLFTIERPLRTVLERESWSFDGDIGDTIGRLFENGSERYIFRQDQHKISARFALSQGDPEVAVYRYSFGWDFLEANFSEASPSDYADLSLDPADLEHDPALLPEDRKFTGPLIGMQKIDPDFISLSYIDRFDRVQDYNLGDEYSIDVTLAPTLLGSDESAFFISGNRNRGLRLGPTSFVRGEIGAASRIVNDAFENNLLRAELKWYNVIGEKHFLDYFVGKHTLAGGIYADYGDNLDRDREFLVGGDNALRGYEAKTFAGDKRLVLNLEDRIHLVDDLFRIVSLGAAVFVDAGGASRRSIGDIFANRMFADVGFGLRFAFPRSSGGRVLRLDVAFPLRDGPDGSDRFSPRILFGGGQLFGSSLRSESFGPEKANVEIGFDQ